MQGNVSMSQAFLAVTTDAHDAERSLLHAVRRLYESPDCQDTARCRSPRPLLDEDRLRRSRDGAARPPRSARHRPRLLHRAAAPGTTALADPPDTRRWMSRGAQLDRDRLVHYALDPPGRTPSHHPNNGTKRSGVDDRTARS